MQKKEIKEELKKIAERIKYGNIKVEYTVHNGVITKANVKSSEMVIFSSDKVQGFRG